MARTATLASLQAQVRQRADMVGSEFITDAELAEYVNQSAAELYGMLVHTDEDYYLAKTTLLTVSGQAEYSFASLSLTDVLKFKGLDVPITGGFKRAADRLEWPERNALSGPLPSYVTGFPTRYHVGPSSVTLYPTPNGGLSCTFWYIPNPPRLDVGGTITFDGCEGWEEYIVLDAAAKCLFKEQSLEAATLLLQQKDLLSKRILTNARRDFGGPKHISKRRFGRNGASFPRLW